jgi:glycosyltransferase involved in cell wall biosynthesis
VQQREPKITIITVILDNTKFVQDAINSVLDQTFTNIEYVIIDGGSKDGSIDVINSYGDKITKFVSEPDEGIYDAMNKGISLATGEIIGFLNSDDFYQNSNVIATIASGFTQGVDAVYADLDYVSRSDKNKVERKWRSGEYNINAFYSGWMPPHPTFFVKAAIYKKYGGYNSTLKYSADYELMLRLCLVNKITVKYIPEVLVKMRVGGYGNRSLRSRINANVEDRKAWQLLNIKPRFFTFLLKPLRKITQYF